MGSLVMVALELCTHETIINSFVYQYFNNNFKMFIKELNFHQVCANSYNMYSVCV